MRRRFHRNACAHRSAKHGCIVGFLGRLVGLSSRSGLSSPALRYIEGETESTTLFGPRITVFTKDGRHFTKEGTGREFIWDFEEEARRIRPMTPGLAISEAQFAELIDTCRHLDRHDRAAEKLIGLTIPS